MSDEYLNDYVRRLLIERPYIRARIENPGGSVILTGVAADTERTDEYSAQIGSGFHLDLLEAELANEALPKDQRDANLIWALGITAKQAAMYFSAKGEAVRKRRERGVKALTEKMNDGTTNTGGTGRRATETRRPPTRRFTA